MKRAHWLSLIALIFTLLVGLLSGCTPEPTVEDPLAQHLRFLLLEEPTSLDPTTANESYGAPILYHAFEPLVREDKEGHIIPALAESWSIEADNTQFTFKIRENAKWSDGTPITAQQMLETFNYMFDSTSASKNAGLIIPYILNASAFNKGEVAFDQVGVKALDESTLVLTTNSPTPYFLQILSFAVFSPVRIDIVKANGVQWFENPTNYVSNGPFTMKSYEKGKSIVLESNPYYWNSEAIALKKLTFYFGGAEADPIAMYRAGEIDGIYEVSTSDLRTNPDLESNIYTHVAPSTSFIVLNHKNLLMADLDFRAAIESSLDREAIVDQVLLGAGIPSRYLVPFSYKLNDEPFHDFTALSKAQDLEKSKAYLEAVKNKGFDLEAPIRIFALDTGNDLNVAKAISKVLTDELGLKVEVTSMPWGDLFDKAMTAEYDLIMLGFGGDYPHPMTFLSNCTSEGILSQILSWYDPNYDGLLNDTLKIADEKQALENFRTLESMVIDDHHLINLYLRKKITLMSSRIEGWYRNSSSQFVFTEAKTK